MRAYVQFILICLWMPVVAQTWHNLGNAGFSAGTANFTSIALDSVGTVYVAFQDGGNGNKATVMQYTNGSWSVVGNPGFSAGQAYYTSLVLDGVGVPYVAYQDVANGNKASVMKYNGNNWLQVGQPGFSAGQAFYVSLAIDQSGVPYLVYQDYADSGKASVMKFNGTDWIRVGTSGFSAGQVGSTSIAINNHGDPYVTFEDFANGNRATAMKYNGSNWINVGIPGFSAGAANYTSIAIDRYDTPYVAFNQTGANVFKFNGSSWVQVGFPRFSGPESFTSIAIADSGVVYVAGSDLNYSSRAFVSVYDTSVFHTWTSVSGSASSDAARYTSLAVDKNNVPYLVYSDERNGYKVSVMVFSLLQGIAEPLYGNTLAVYPNPSNGAIQIISNITGDYQLVNGIGQIVYSFPLSANSPFEINDLPIGIYILNGNGMAKKLIIE